MDTYCMMYCIIDIMYKRVEPPLISLYFAHKEPNLSLFYYSYSLYSF